MSVGTNSRAIFEGMLAGVRFARTIGPERIYARAHQLARMAQERAARLPYLELLTPGDERMYGALVTFRMSDRVDRTKLFQKCVERKIWTLKGQQLRLSTHIHTRPEDLDLFFRTLEESV
jgi:selenocysteine lyase/cysteine desulfurase